ncbi:MAG: hypothetical protein R6W75_06935 [Smithellaceae bacterium]
MSKRKLPDYRLRQKILHIDKTPPEALIRYGDTYLESGAVSDALDFYTKAAHTSGVQNIRHYALDQGDAFLFLRASKALNEDPDPSEWRAIAHRAIELKKISFARHALEKINDMEGIQALTMAMKAEEAEKSA